MISEFEKGIATGKRQGYTEGYDAAFWLGIRIGVALGIVWCAGVMLAIQLISWSH